MIINHNISAEFANRTLRVHSSALDRNIEKLSSGLRINRAADDPSGLAISEKLRSQIRGLRRAERNIQDAVSFIQTGEGYLQQTQDVLHRIRELSVQAANGIYSDSDRENIQSEFSQLIDEVDRIASHAQFNGLNLLTGRFARDSQITDGVQVQVGANIDQNERAYIATVTTAALGLQEGTSDGVSVASSQQANISIGVVDNALKTVSQQRANLGAYQHRFELAQQGVAVAAENLTAAESYIRDTDMAQEVVDFVKNRILFQSNTAVLAQANIQAETILQLLG